MVERSLSAVAIVYRRGRQRGCGASGIIMPLGPPAGLRDGAAVLLYPPQRVVYAAPLLMAVWRLSSDAAMRSVLIRLCLAAVLVLLEVGMVLGAVT